MEQDKLPGLQIARAVAAISIAYFHSWKALERFPEGTALPIPILRDFGWLAVDLFFAISGFVICLVVSKSMFNIRSFLTKRVFRLYPLWLLTLSLFAILALLWRGPRETETVGYFLYSATLLPTEQFPFYDIGWSLQHEMAFYFLAALVVPVFGLYGLAAFLALSTLANHVLELPWYLSKFMFYHPEFLAGVLAFLLRPKLIRLGFWIPASIGIFGFWYLFAVQGGRVFAGIPLFFLILGFANIKESNRLKPFGVLGDSSYSIYLIHPLVFSVASALTTKISVPIWSQEVIRFGGIALVCFASVLSWKMFETPINRWGAKLVLTWKDRPPYSQRTT